MSPTQNWLLAGEADSGARTNDQPRWLDLRMVSVWQREEPLTWVDFNRLDEKV